MKFRYAVSALLALTSVVAVACDDDDDDPTGGSNTPEIFNAALTGAAERPTPVVTTATGTATFSWEELSGGADEVTYSVSATGLSGNASLAHIHGPADDNASAPPIVTLTLTSVGNNGVIASGTFTTTGHATISMDSLRVLLRNERAYVNVHTATNPNGEIRGTIR